MFKIMLKYGLILLVVCFIASALLSGVFVLTSPKIQMQKEKERQEAFLTVMPQAAVFEEVKVGGEVLYYTGYADAQKSRLAGYVFLCSGKGYSGTIEIMAGIDPLGNVTGIKILTQAETPGLGARVDEIATDRTLFGPAMQESEIPKAPWFQEQFRGKLIKDLIVVKHKTGENIQAITGATITSEAVTEAVRKKALEIYDIIKEKR